MESLKEFCSGCRQFYDIPDGIWMSCPCCDSLGNLLTEEEKSRLLKQTDDNHKFTRLRERWDIKAR
ncbi:MAG: hypothetical protein ACE5EA_10985 [Nitrospirota bacterium]